MCRAGARVWRREPAHTPRVSAVGSEDTLRFAIKLSRAGWQRLNMNICQEALVAFEEAPLNEGGIVAHSARSYALRIASAKPRS